MTDSIVLIPHSNEWMSQYEGESELLKKIFSSFLIDIQHIGSTAVPDLISKPIIDIAVQITTHTDAEKFIQPLEKIGYVYKADKSSTERHFFQKGNPTQFHLSLSYLDQGGYWDRQILFRNYLITHSEVRREYEQIKLKAADKTEFVQKILALAESK